MAEKKVTQADVKADREDVARQIGAENDRGYVGTVVDPTPNENYTLRGVGAGKPTPETDPAQAKKAAQAQADSAEHWANG